MVYEIKYVVLLTDIFYLYKLLNLIKQGYLVFNQLIIAAINRNLVIKWPLFYSS